MTNIRTSLLAIVLGLSACASKTIPLPKVEPGDPVSQLNPDRWQATVNDLIVPPGDGTRQPLPAPVSTGSDKVPQL